MNYIIVWVMSKTVEFNISEEELEHVKRITNLIQDDKMDFLDDDQFKSMIHSVVGES